MKKNICFKKWIRDEVFLKFEILCNKNTFLAIFSKNVLFWRADSKINENNNLNNLNRQNFFKYQIFQVFSLDLEAQIFI